MSNDTPHSAVSALDQLEEQQQLFVRELMRDLNQTKAAIRAGYSENTAATQASRLLTNVKVKTAFDELKAIRNENIGVDAGYVLKRLIDIDQLDVLDILDDKGAIKPVNEWSAEWRQNISSFEVADDGQGGSVVKLKFPDKVKNLELIGKHVEVGAWITSSQVDHTSSDKSMSPPVFNIVGVSPDDTSASGDSTE